MNIELSFEEYSRFGQTEGGKKGLFLEKKEGEGRDYPEPGVLSCYKRLKNCLLL